MTNWTKPKRIGLSLLIVVGLVDVVVGLLNLSTIRHAGEVVAWPQGGVLLLTLVLGAVMAFTAAVALAVGPGKAATAASVAAIFQALTMGSAILENASPAWLTFASVIVVSTTVAVGLTLSRPKRTDPI